MPPLSAYASTLPAEVLNNPAVLFLGSAVLGATKGGIGWDGEETWEDLEYDGKRSMYVVGLTRLAKYGGKLSGSLIQVGKTDGTELARLLPNATVGAGTPPITTLVTPTPAGEFLASAEYLADVRALWELGDGTNYFAVHLPFAFASKWSIKAGSDGQAEVDFELCAARDAAAVEGVAPYTYEFRSAKP